MSRYDPKIVLTWALALLFCLAFWFEVFRAVLKEDLWLAMK